MSKLLLIPITSLAILISLNVQAGDPTKGHELHQAHCIKCHGNEVYTRENRMVTDLPGLHKQVRFCEQNLNLTWFDEEIDHTATYLNQGFYKFEQKPESK
jgi:hypothetical protein